MKQQHSVTSEPGGAEGNYRSLETMMATLEDIRAHMRAGIIPLVTPGWSTDITPHYSTA